MVQQDQQQLGSVGTGSIPGPAKWIWRCHSCCLVQDSSSDLIPGPGVPFATGWPKEKKKEEEERREEEETTRVFVKDYTSLQTFKN